MIHPTAVISESATIGENVTIGPFCVVDDNVTIGDGCILKSHVVVRGPTRIGKNNKFYQFSSIGEDCQDKKYAGEPTELVIGDDNEFREGVTVHRGTIQDNSITIIGSRCLFMANSHVAHDCVLGNDIIIANSVAIAGHVHMDDHVIVSAFNGHNFFFAEATTLKSFRINTLRNIFLTADHNKRRHVAQNNAASPQERMRTNAYR